MYTITFRLRCLSYALFLSFPLLLSVGSSDRSNSCSFGPPAGIRRGCTQNCAKRWPLCPYGRGPTLSDPGRSDSQLQRMARRTAAGLAVDGRIARQYDGGSGLLGANGAPAGAL